MPLFSNVFPPHIIAFTSDRTVDFSLHHDSLSDHQKTFLARQLHEDLPEPVAVCQVHGDRVIIVDRDSSHHLGEADGLISKEKDVMLTVRTADCLPLFLYDPRREGIGLVHAGWQGARKGIVERAIRLMEDQWRTNPQDVVIAFGPCIRSCCYEVGGEFRAYFPDEVEARGSAYFFDLARVVVRQLAELGIDKKNMTDNGICTCCDENYFSYRREGNRAGRMLSLMMMKSKKGV